MIAAKGACAFGAATYAWAAATYFGDLALPAVRGRPVNRFSNIFRGGRWGGREERKLKNNNIIIPGRGREGKGELGGAG